MAVQVHPQVHFDDRSSDCFSLKEAHLLYSSFSRTHKVGNVGIHVQLLIKNIVGIESICIVTKN